MITDREPRPGDFRESPDLGKRIPAIRICAGHNAACLTRPLSVSHHAPYTVRDLRKLTEGTRYDQ